jgi:hypothetical protein
MSVQHRAESHRRRCVPAARRALRSRVSSNSTQPPAPTKSNCAVRSRGGVPTTPLPHCHRSQPRGTRPSSSHHHEKHARKATCQPSLAQNLLQRCRVGFLSLSLSLPRYGRHRPRASGLSFLHHAIISYLRLPGRPMLFGIHAARFMHCRYRPQGPLPSPCTLRLFAGWELHNKSRPCCVTGSTSHLLFRLSSA